MGAILGIVSALASIAGPVMSAMQMLGGGGGGGGEQQAQQGAPIILSGYQPAPYQALTGPGALATTTGTQQATQPTTTGLTSEVTPETNIANVPGAEDLLKKQKETQIMTW